MPVKVGTDLVEIERFRLVLERRPRLREKIFTQEELRYCDSKPQPFQHLAARFSAKEAFSKAVGTGVRSFSMREVEVCRDGFGKPGILLTDRALDLAQKLKIVDMDLSISHSQLFVISVVVIETGIL